MTTNSFALIQSPFQRLRDLLGNEPPGAPPIDMTIGEPRHGVPGFIADIIARHALDFGKYPPIPGTPELRRSIAQWLRTRYSLAEGTVDPDAHLLPLCGTREGLISALLIAKARASKANPAVLMPNPFYQAYYAGAVAADCEPILLSAGVETDFLPDFDAVPAATWERVAAVYLASPANPQGTIASADVFARLIALARRYNFYIFSDECYSEIYFQSPPVGALEVAAATGSFDKVLVFNSLSKRSNAPGLRSGFIAGDASFLRDYLQFRNVASPQIPLPIQQASAALWLDETHVEESRALYRKKLMMVQDTLGHFPDLRIPEGGFFLWLNLSPIGGGVTAAKTIWKGCGVKVLPGAYLALADSTGENPADCYARLALVDPLERTREALDRLAKALVG